MPTALTYARFSSVMQHDSSIEAQQDAIAKYASAHGIDILEQYADRARSGTNDDRPGFQSMIASLKHRPVDYVLVHKIDRFARNRYDAAIYSRIIKERGARLVAVAQDFGTGPEAVIMEGLMQAMAEYYSLNLSTEIKKGKTVRAKAGKYSGGITPFGYRSDGNGSLMIKEDEAFFVRKFFQAAIDGTPYAPIVRELTAAGITGRLGKPFNSNLVSGMLRLPVYSGTMETWVNGELHRFENHHPAIVSPDIQKEAIHMLDTRSRAGHESLHRIHLCSGITYCGKCGSKMSGNTQKARGKYYFSYVCKGRCGIRSIPALELETAACNYVNAVLSPKTREELAQAVRVYIAGQTEAARQRAPEAQREIKKLRAEISALIANMSAGVLSAAVLEQLGKQVEEKQARIALLMEMKKQPPQLTPDLIDNYFGDCAAISPDDADSLHTQRVLRHFIERIDVYDDHIQFTSTLDTWLREHQAGLPSAEALISPDAEKNMTDHSPASSCPPGTASFDRPVR